MTVVGPKAWKAFGAYRELKKEIQTTQSLALAALTKQRDDCVKDITELKRDLRNKQREIEEKDDMSRQDRAHIRLLKVRLRDNNIDIDDIEEQIRRFFNGNGRNGK